jgi:ATP-dependent RNA helicase DDX35
VSSPPAKNLLASLEVLYGLGALNIDGELTSEIGYFMAEMPINPMMSKMLYTSVEFQCTDEILSIIAMLQVQNIFSKPTSGQGQINARLARRHFEVKEGDLLTLLNVFTGKFIFV